MWQMKSSRPLYLASSINIASLPRRLICIIEAKVKICLDYANRYADGQSEASASFAYLRSSVLAPASGLDIKCPRGTRRNRPSAISMNSSALAAGVVRDATFAGHPHLDGLVLAVAFPISRSGYRLRSQGDRPGWRRAAAPRSAPESYSSIPGSCECRRGPV